MHLYCGDQPQPGAAVQAGWQQAPQAICIDRVADIEESIWAPRFGLKGMIDATVTAHFGPLQQVSPLPGLALLGGCSRSRAQCWPSTACMRRASAGCLPLLLQAVKQLQMPDFVACPGRQRHLGSATAPSRPQLHALPHRRDRTALACCEQASSGLVKAPGQPKQFQGWGVKELSQRSPLKARTGKGSMPDRARLMPLEFKSGRAHHTHRAQAGPAVLCRGLTWHPSRVPGCLTLWCLSLSNLNLDPAKRSCTQRHDAAGDEDEVEACV